MKTVLIYKKYWDVYFQEYRWYKDFESKVYGENKYFVRVKRNWYSKKQWIPKKTENSLCVKIN